MDQQQQTIRICRVLLQELTNSPHHFNSRDLIEAINTISDNDEELKKLALRNGLISLLNSIVETASR